MIVGAKFCSHCGASAARTEVSNSDKVRCPRCQADMKTIMIGGSGLQECPQCEGIWSDAETLQRICTEKEKQAAVLGMPAPAAEPADMEKDIRYFPCPMCQQLMNRVNFAHYSGVVLDVCKAHGTWFDKDKLRRTVEFIRAGGLEKARAHQIDQLEEERRRLEATRNAGVPLDLEQSSGSDRGRQSRPIADLFRSLLG
ncbi:MAG: zf-TFIIB domain-containing protein [Candidatus Korobacteraceae bacterium]